MNILQIVSKLDTSDKAQDVIASTRFLTLNGHKVIVVSEKSALVKEIDEVGAWHYPISPRPNILSVPITIFKLSRLILEENIQVVHARDAFSSFVAFFASRFMERAFIVTVYEHYKKNLLKKPQFWAKRVICLSESSARNLVKGVLISQDKVRVIPPFVDSMGTGSAGRGVSVRKFHTETPLPARGPKKHPSPPSFTIIAALPLYFPEATQSFIKTISILSRKIHKLRVFIIGRALRYKKEPIEKLKLLIKRHSLNNIVTFLPGEEERALISEANLFVQVNRDPIRIFFSNGVNEALSARRLLQAQACGIPIVATDIDWIKEYVEDNRTGIVCGPGDLQEMTAKIFDLYRNEKLREEMSNAARRFVGEKFNTKKIMESTLDVYQEAISSRNILIIKIGALGDVILAIPSVRAIREKSPTAKIKLLVGIDNREVFVNSPLIDDIIVCDFKERDRGLGGLLRIARRLRAEDFDIVVDLQNNKKSHILSFLSCAPKRYGYDNGKLSFLLNRKVKDARLPLDPIAHQSKVLGLLGIYNIDKRLELWPSREDEEWADNFLTSHWVKDNTKLVAVNIGSSPRWITKLWPVEYLTEVCNRLAKDFGIRVILIGSKMHSRRIETFLKRAKCKPINALGKTNIPRLASLIKRCNLLLSSDSAPIHVAAGVATPFIALFGPTDPARHLPPSKGHIVFKKNLDCSPCYRTYCDRGYACMRLIKPDEVYEAVLRLLGIKGGNSKQTIK